MTTTKQSGGLPERHKAHLSRPPKAEFSLHSAEKTRDTTLDDETYDVRYSGGCPIGKSISLHIARRRRDGAL